MARNVASLTTTQAGHRAIVIVGEKTFALRAVGEITEHFVDLIENANDFKRVVEKVLAGHQGKVLSAGETTLLKDALEAVSGDLEAVTSFLKPALITDTRASVAAVRYKTLKEGRQMIALHSRLTSTIDNIHAVMKQLSKKKHQSRPTSRPIANERRHRQSSQNRSIATSISSVTMGDDTAEHAKPVSAGAESTTQAPHRCNPSGSEDNAQTDTSSNSDRHGDADNHHHHHHLHPINELEGDVPTQCPFCEKAARLRVSIKAEPQPEMSNMIQVNADEPVPSSSRLDHDQSSTTVQAHIPRDLVTTQTTSDVAEQTAVGERTVVADRLAEAQRTAVPEHSHAAGFAERRRQQRETREQQRELFPNQPSRSLCTARGDLYSAQPDAILPVMTNTETMAARHARSTQETSSSRRNQRDSGYDSPDLSVLNSPGVVNQSVWVSPSGLLKVDVQKSIVDLKRSGTMYDYYKHHPLSDEVDVEQGQDTTRGDPKKQSHETVHVDSEVQQVRGESSSQAMSRYHVSFREPHHRRAASDPSVPTLSIDSGTPIEQSHTPFQPGIVRYRSLVARKPVPAALSTNNAMNLSSSIIEEEDLMQNRQLPVMNPRLADPVQPVHVEHPDLLPPPLPPRWTKPRQYRDELSAEDRNAARQTMTSTQLFEDLSRQNPYQPQIRDGISLPSEPLRRALAQEAQRHQLRVAAHEAVSQNEYLDRARMARMRHASGGAFPSQPNTSFARDLCVPGPSDPGRVSPLTPEQRRPSPHRPVVAPSRFRTMSNLPAGQDNIRVPEARSDMNRLPDVQNSEDEFENPVIERAQEVPVTRLAQLSMHSAPFIHSQLNFPQRQHAQPRYQSRNSDPAVPHTRADARTTAKPPPPPPPPRDRTQAGQIVPTRPAIRSIPPPGRIDTAGVANRIALPGIETPTSPISRILSPPPGYSTLDPNDPTTGSANIPDRHTGSGAAVNAPSSPAPAHPPIHHMRLTEGQRSHSDPITTTTQVPKRRTVVPTQVQLQARPSVPARSEPRAQHNRQRTRPRKSWWHSPEEVGPLSPT